MFFIVICVALLNWKHEQGMIKGLLPFCIKKTEYMQVLLLGEEMTEESMMVTFKISSSKEDVAAEQLYF